MWLLPMPRNPSLTVSNCGLEKIGALASASSSLSFSLCVERRFCPVNPESLADILSVLQRAKTGEKAEKSEWVGWLVSWMDGWFVRQLVSMGGWLGEWSKKICVCRNPNPNVVFWIYGS